MTLKVLGVIPARLGSTRLPRKVLADIYGKPMVQWVYERVAGLRYMFLVATESDEVAAACSKVGIPVEMTSPEHATGTDRLCEVADRHPWFDSFVNVQADEPMVTGAHVDALLSGLRNMQDACASTLCFPVGDGEQGPVRVVRDGRGNALYFSRQLLPGSYGHQGLYAYSRKALDVHRKNEQPLIEHLERLEQLRLLYYGVPIRVVDSPGRTQAVDTAEDLETVRRLLGA